MLTVQVNTHSVCNRLCTPLLFLLHCCLYFSIRALALENPRSVIQHFTSIHKRALAVSFPQFTDNIDQLKSTFPSPWMTPDISLISRAVVDSMVPKHGCSACSIAVNSMYVMSFTCKRSPLSTTLSHSSDPWLESLPSSFNSSRQSASSAFRGWLERLIFVSNALRTYPAVYQIAFCS